jgi:hypothetical protein
MKTQNPLRFTIRNGHFAEGKQINVEYGTTGDGELDALLANLIARIRQPTDKINVRCKSVYTEKGKFTACEVSLTTDFDNSD